MLSFLVVARALLKVGPSPALEPSSEPVVTVSWVDVTCISTARCGGAWRSGGARGAFVELGTGGARPSGICSSETPYGGRFHDSYNQLIQWAEK